MRYYLGVWAYIERGALDSRVRSPRGTRNWTVSRVLVSSTPLISVSLLRQIRYPTDLSVGVAFILVLGTW